MMARVMLVGLAMLAASAAQAPVPAEKEPFHREVFHNEHLEAVEVEIPPHQTTQLHRHDHDYVAVSLTDSTVTAMVPGKEPVQEKRHTGQVWMGKRTAHQVRNDGDTLYRATSVEFLAAQGEAKPVNRKASHYCNPHSKTACVNERYLFCTNRVCVSEVEMGPEAVTIRHSHSTDHLVIAVSDLEMRDWIEGRPAAVLRDQKSGQVLYLDAGITHQLANGSKPARMIVVSWK